MLIGEVISTFDKWVRLKLITEKQFREIVGSFANDLKELTDNSALILEDISYMHMIFSVDYIIKYHLAVNDSIHLYTALINRKEIEGFVCSDENLCNAARNENLEVINPEK